MAVKRWNGTSWEIYAGSDLAPVKVTDGRVGKTTFIGATTPTGMVDGDIWIDQDTATNAVVPTALLAKGDIFVATASGTYTRLAVGNNGETLVADSSTSTGLRYNPQNALANPIINGGMDVWQRGTSIARSGTGGTAADYTADRWVYGGSGGSAATISRQTTSDTTNLPNIQYCARFQRNSGNADTSFLYFAYVFENFNSTPFIGKTITVSFYARKGANYSATSNALSINVGTGTGTDQSFFNFSGVNTPLGVAATLTDTWQRFSTSGTLSSSGTQMRLYFTFAPTGTAGANDWFEVTGVQIDLGTYTASTAPTFRRSGGTLAGELAACQRYYLRHSYSGTNSGLIGPAYARTTGIAFATWTFPVTMRATPTLAFSNATQYFNLQIAGGDATFNTLSGSSLANTDRASLRADAGTHTIGQAGVLSFNNSAAWIEGSAEL